MESSTAVATVIKGAGLIEWLIVNKINNERDILQLKREVAGALWTNYIMEILFQNNLISVVLFQYFSCTAVTTVLFCKHLIEVKIHHVCTVCSVYLLL